MQLFRKIVVVAIFALLIGVNFAAVVNWQEKNKDNDDVNIEVLDRYGIKNGDFKLKRQGDGTYDLVIWTDSGAKMKIYGLVEVKPL